MKYIVKEGKLDGKYNAINKAREDVENILKKEDFKELYIPTIYPIRHGIVGKIVQAVNYIHNDLIWKKHLKKLNKDDVIFIQYPLINKCFDVTKIIKKYNSKIKFIVLVHDLDSIRYMYKKDESQISKKRRKKADLGVVENANYVIVHNKKMHDELKKQGVMNNNIYELGLFDYLLDKPVKTKRNKNDGVVIAGNLKPEKVKYIKMLNEAKNVKFNLYGVGYESQGYKNIDYKGSFLPDELPQKLKGAFGLVWDGDGIQGCTGVYGHYLKYNNPHKISLYLASNMPVVVWKESALAKFIEDNKLGISISNIKEIDKKIKTMSQEDYKKMCDNVNKISNKLRKGGFLQEALNKINENGGD